MHSANDVGKFAPSAQFNSDTAVAREVAGAGQHQIPQPGEASHGVQPSTAGHDQPRHFCQAASDQGGNGIVAQAEAIADSRGDGDNIFQRSAEFDADDIVVGI